MSAFDTYLPSTRIHALSDACHWSMDSSVVRCSGSVLCQTFIFTIERHE